MKSFSWFILIVFIALMAIPVAIFLTYRSSDKRTADLYSAMRSNFAEIDRRNSEATDRLRNAFPSGRLVRIGDSSQQAVILSNDHQSVKVLANSGPVDLNPAILHLLPSTSATVMPAEALQHEGAPESAPGGQP